jgi:hypothetical protein
MPHDWTEEQIINRLRKEYSNKDRKVMAGFIYDHRDKVSLLARTPPTTVIIEVDPSRIAS